MRVPARYASIEARREIYVSLRTDSHSEALERAAAVRRDMLAMLDARLAGKIAQTSPESERARHKRIVALAASHGWSYQPADELAALPLEPLVERLTAVEKAFGRTGDADIIAAGAGGVSAPVHCTSELVTIYEAAATARLGGKTPDQLRKWRNPLLRAQADLINLVGRKPITALSAEDARLVRAHYRDLVASGQILDDTANKRIGFMRSLIRGFYREMGGVDPAIFAGYRIEGATRSRAMRPEFPVGWIEKHLYCPDPLPGLNEQARDIVLILESTGCRPSEIASIAASSIRLDAEIPHYRVEFVDRSVKNADSIRDVPLVGQALAAARRHPHGFPRYRGKDTLSNAVNKYLKSSGTLPGDDFVLYSLRHAFEGRMKRAGIDPADRAAMMGHSRKAATGRERYGDDPTLAEKLTILRRMGIPDA